MATRWWHLGTEAVIQQLGTDGKVGLSSTAAADRQRTLGANELEGKKGRGPLAIFLDQFKSLMIGVLIAAALVSGFLNEWVDALAILAIVILNAILGLLQEYRAEKSLAALKRLSAPSSKVVRDGAAQVIPARDLVPGDLVELEAGDHVPADGRVIWRTSNFAAQEASLTGESTPVGKTDIALEEKEIPLAERANIVYLGTSVVSGKARAIVVETGMQTELGRIAGLIQEVKKETTPLQRKLEQFSKLLVYLCFFLVSLVFGLEILRGGKVVDVFPDRGQPCRRRHPRGPAGRGHHRPRPGCSAHGPAACLDPQAALGRDAGLRHGDLLGQDGYSDQERDDRPGRLDVAGCLRGDGLGLRSRRRVPDGHRSGRPRRVPGPAPGPDGGRPVQQRPACGRGRASRRLR
jgi:hypothetical protein